MTHIIHGIKKKQDSQWLIELRKCKVEIIKNSCGFEGYIIHPEHGKIVILENYKDPIFSSIKYIRNQIGSDKDWEKAKKRMQFFYPEKMEN